MSNSYFNEVATKLREAANVFDSGNIDNISELVNDYEGAYCSFDAPFIDIDIDFNKLRNLLNE